MSLLDFPPEIRAKRLARIGMTEAEYREELKRREAELEREAKGGLPPAPTSDKFTSVPGGILNDDAIE